MQTKLKHKLQNALFFLTIISLIVNCSKSKSQKEEKFETPAKTQIVDNNSLFDGKTLNGWKVTEYGTQGPVTVSEGKIILNYDFSSCYLV